MGVLSWLRQRTPSQTAIVEITFAPPPDFFVSVDLSEDQRNEIHEADFEQAAQPVEKATRYDLEPLFLVIDYRDASGNCSRRRVTTRWIEKRGDVSYVGATCHERRAHRLFRMDRIEGVIDDDGVVEAAIPFFAEVIAGDTGYEVEKLGNNPQKGVSSPSASPYTLLRRELKPAIVVLAAAARVDNLLHPEETDRIMLFTETEAECLAQEGIITELPDLDAFDKLGRLVCRMRPTQKELDEALNVVAHWPEARLQRLIQSISGVIQADRVIVPSEFEFLREMTEWAQEQSW